ncbi:MAG: 2Fe-2S iron-sulfur cluster-binding protein [Tenericutes bacterium]|jgi:NADH dehydrogenase/NADH:ubiquinone oxidoreductase subunit G|nr:2Fe-2S iron-sulfur cluster-binding protein [Mycoplasmatota bacterium]
MNIKIDGIEIEVTDENRNIVEVAEESGIAIIAPCFRSSRKGGCCKVCLIEVDGEQKYACGTKPIDGMNIVYNTPILREYRDIAMKKYIESLNSDKKSSCCGSEVTPIDGKSCCSTSGCDC